VGTFKDAPKHDWTSHAADAFRYLCMAWRSINPEEKPKDALKELLRKKTLSEWVNEYEEARNSD
jgi:hypothetical protein